MRRYNPAGLPAHDERTPVRPRSNRKRSAALLSAVALAAAGALALPGAASGAIFGLQDDQLSSGPLEEVDERLPLIK